jgi:hypothetical protein
VLGVIVGTAGATTMWGIGSPDWQYGASGPSPVVFSFDTLTGTISQTFTFSSENWMWTAGIADSGTYLYVAHNQYDTAKSQLTHDFAIAKVDRATGAVLSDTRISGFLGQTYSQVNALDFKDGKLYAVENATSGSALRGDALEIKLDVNGDPIGTTVGAYVGAYPDCGLDYHDGVWYATWWRTDNSSWVATSSDIMNTNFSSTMYTKPVGLIDGLEFDDSRNAFIAVSWYDTGLHVYSLDGSWNTTSLYSLQSQLPGDITQLNGLSEVVPEPLTMMGLTLGLGGVGTYIRRQRMV